MNVKNEYNPDYFSIPGETLKEILSERKISSSDLARQTAIPLKTLKEIFLGINSITPEIALKLEKAIGTPANFWIARERQYREALDR